jgi:GTP cyclohydrolase I
MDVAVRTLIEWTSDDPDREGCAAPERDVRAYSELFEGYRIDPIRVLQPAARSRINMTAWSF